MSRFSDDLELVAPQDYVPTSLPALLRHLHIEQAPRSKQEAAVRSWLKEHPPGKLMAYSLDRMGFGHLIDRRTTA